MKNLSLMCLRIQMYEFNNEVKAISHLFPNSNIFQRLMKKKPIDTFALQMSRRGVLFKLYDQEVEKYLKSDFISDLVCLAILFQEVSCINLTN